MSEWISVEERLPEMHRDPMGCRQSEKVIIFMPQSKTAKIQFAKAWVGRNGLFWLGRGRYFEPTHWMPLPEVPKPSS